MKKVSEIREEASELYNKSSHYIVGTFFAISCITGLAKAILEVLGGSYNMPMLILLTALFSPFEYGMVKASLLAYERKAREVDTKVFTLAGLKKYFKIFAPFAGKTLVVYAFELFIVVLFAYGIGRSVEQFNVAVTAILTGSLDNIISSGKLMIQVGTLVGICLALISGVILEGYFCLTYYYAIDYDVGFGKALGASFKSMSGNLSRYILIRLSYLPMMLLSTVIVTLVTVSLQTLFSQLIVVMNNVPLFAFNLAMAIITALVSTLVSVMLYQVKQALAITILYKEVELKSE